MTAPTLGTLDLLPFREQPDLLAPPVRDLLSVHDALAASAYVCAIDPDLADTAALTAAYALPETASANCVVVLGRRGEDERLAACVALADSRVDVNKAVRKRLDVRKVSFAPQERAVGETGMEYGGITPVGVPESWPVLVDSRVVEQDWVILGSGLRRSKLVLPGASVAQLPGAEVGEYAAVVPAS